MTSKLETVKNSKLTQPETKFKKSGINLAASWYIAMRSEALGKEPKAVELFGQPLVAWRDQNGHPVIMQRYCSHMGASLALGKVVNSCIQCAFHHWHFDSSGQCVATVPKVDRIPLRARQATHVTTERYGYIWIWYGSETPLFPLPDFPAAESERHNYMPYRFAHYTNTSVRQVLDNTYDQYHLLTIHELQIPGSIPLTLLNNYPAQQSETPIPKEAWFGALIEFPFSAYIGKLDFVAKALGLKGKTVTLFLDGWPSGQRVTGFLDGKEIYKAILCTTPITESKTVQEILMMIKKTDNFLLNIFNYLFFGVFSKFGVEQDMPVWDTINTEMGGAYIESDLGVLKYREFYQRWVKKVE